MGEKCFRSHFLPETFPGVLYSTIFVVLTHPHAGSSSLLTHVVRVPFIFSEHFVDAQEPQEASRVDLQLQFVYRRFNAKVMR